MAKEYVAYSGPIVTREDARAGGLEWYFTGIACRNKHIARRSVKDERCYACTLANVGSRKRSSDKWRHANKEKLSLAHKAWVIKNLERDKELKKRWALANLDRTRDGHKKWCLENRDRRRASSQKCHRGTPERTAARNLRVKVWYYANREKTLAAKRAKYKENPEPMRAVRKEWIKNNPDKVRVRNQNRRARKRNAPGSFTLSDVKKLFSLQKGRCAYCIKSIKNHYDIEHIVPLVKGGSNWPSNLCLACGPCNSSKSAKDAIQWAQEQGRLL